MWAPGTFVSCCWPLLLFVLLFISAAAAAAAAAVAVLALSSLVGLVGWAVISRTLERGEGHSSSLHDRLARHMK
jgi:hypothetical protein